MMIFVIYVAIALLVAWFGRKRRIGFAGWFLLSMILTPPFASLILLISEPTPGA